VAQHGRGMTDGLTALKDGDYQGAAMAFGSMALGGKKMGRGGGSGSSNRSGFAQGPGTVPKPGKTPKRGDRLSNNDNPDALPSIEDAQRNKTKQRPSIKDLDQNNEWFGVKNRPKQNAIESIEKMKKKNEHYNRRSY